MVSERSSVKKGFLTLDDLTVAKVGSGCLRRGPRNPSAQEARKNCSNSSVASGDKCSVTNDSRLKIKQHVVQRQVTAGHVLSESRHNLSSQVSRNARASRSDEESNMV